MSAIVWDDEITMTPVASKEEATGEVVWDDEVNLEPVTNDASGISEQVLKEYPNDLEGAKAELSTRLAKAGIDEKEIAKRTTAYNRFATGLAKSLISAYNGITGAEEGDTSYAMETQLNEEAKQQSEDYKATNIVNKSIPNPDADTESWHGGFLGAEPMFKGTETGQATEMATTVGEIAPVAASGMVGGVAGAAFGPVRSAIGAGVADVAYTGAQALSEQSDVDSVDVALSAIFGVGGAGVTRMLNPTALKNFTTINDMPPKEYKAIMHLAKKSMMTKKEMEQHIKEYAKSTAEGVVTNRKAVEAGAKGSEREQIGFATGAMKQDDLSKGTVLEETTKRTNIIEDALRQMDDKFETSQFSDMFTRHTLDDEGRRKATDWKGLEKSMRQRDFEADDPIYVRVKENADTFGTKETDIFRDTVKPASPESGKATELLQPFTETTRANIGSQFGATGIGWIDRVLTRIAPNMDTKTVNMIKRSMKDATNPKELEQALISQGIKKQVANQAAKEMEKQLADDAVLDEKQAKANLTQDVDKFFSENVIPADIKKRFTFAKKHGTADDIEALKKEVLDLAKTKKTEKRKDVLAKGIDALDTNKKRVADEAEEKFVDREVRKDTIKKGLKAKKNIETDHKDLVRTTKNKKKLRSALDNKTKRTEAKEAEQVKTDKLADENRKQRTKEVTAEHEKQSATWEDRNPITGYGKRYNLAKRDYKKAIGTETEEQAKKDLDNIKFIIENKGKKPKAEPKKKGAIEAGVVVETPKGKQTKMDLEPSLFDEPKVKPLKGKGIEDNDVFTGDTGTLKGKQRTLDMAPPTNKKTGQSARELEAQRIKEDNPDNIEEIQGARFASDELSPTRQKAKAEDDWDKVINDMPDKPTEADRDTLEYLAKTKRPIHKEAKAKAKEVLAKLNADKTIAPKVDEEAIIEKRLTEHRESVKKIDDAREAKQTKADELVNKPIRNMSEDEAKAHKVKLTSLALKQIPNSPKQLETRKAIEALDVKAEARKVMGAKRDNTMETLRNTNPRVAKRVDKAFETYESGNSWTTHLKKETKDDPSIYKAYQEAYKADGSPVVEQSTRPKPKPKEAKKPIDENLDNLTEEELELVNGAKDARAVISRKVFLKKYGYDRLVTAVEWQKGLVDSKSLNDHKDIKRILRAEAAARKKKKGS